MSLTVLSVAYKFAPVCPEAVGGAEKILSDLDQALTAAQHTSLVVACEGSRPSGKLFPVPLPTCELLEEADQTWCRRQFQAAIDRALSTHRVHLVHLHGIDFSDHAIPSGVPVLVTLHMPIAWYPPEAWRHFGDRARFCCVSESQRLSCPPDLRGSSVIENGVELSPLRSPAPRGDFALVMGRICPEKNAHAALQAGTLARTRVLLAGQAFAYHEHQDYLHNVIEPLLGETRTGVRHELLGPLSSDQKHDLLARAKCVLHPTLAPETSSLVAMEALAAGTPVIAYRSGALTEIVEDGVTGFLVNSVEEMAEAIRRVDRISTEACRSEAERRFSTERMIRGYFDLYDRLIRAQPAGRRYA